MHCLTNQLKDAKLINRLVADFENHKDQEIYIKYMNQIINANTNMKGDSPMVCEGILNLCGTSSEEIIARTKKEQEEFYLPKINELSNSNEQLSTQINYLKNLLKQNNIPFNLETVAVPNTNK